MKKTVLLLMIAAMLTACSSKESAEPKKDEKTKVEQTVKQEETTASEQTTESKYPFPTSAPVGNAKITLSTPAGDSSNGNVPVLFINPDDMIIQIGADYENFQGDKQTFIYVDKLFEETKQIGQLTQSSVDLEENKLKPGVHTVTAVQFENDDPAGKVINFVEAKYEVKEGK